MSAISCSVVIESVQCIKNTQQGQNWAMPCCCTVAQAARKGHFEEIKELITSGKFLDLFLLVTLRYTDQSLMNVLRMKNRIWPSCLPSLQLHISGTKGWV